jgi:hypothetical protein
MTNSRRALVTLLRLASLVTLLGVGCTAQTGLGDAARDVSRHGPRRDVPSADESDAMQDSEEQALLAATDDQAADETTPVAPESDASMELVASDDSVRCGDGVLDEDELCDISIADGEKGACPTECAALDECHAPAIALRTCWTQCVLGAALPCE